MFHACNGACKFECMHACRHANMPACMPHACGMHAYFGRGFETKFIETDIVVIVEYST
jgi:hypothetical protein